MHDAADRCAAGAARRRRPASSPTIGELAGRARAPTGGPAADLALEVALGAAEVVEAGRSTIDGVQLGERVDESIPSRCRRDRTKARRRRRRSRRGRRTLRDDAERHAEHVGSSHSSTAGAPARARGPAARRGPASSRSMSWAEGGSGRAAHGAAPSRARRRASRKVGLEWPAPSVAVEPAAVAPGTRCHEERLQRPGRGRGGLMPSAVGFVHRSRRRRRAARRAIDQRCVSLGPS